MQTNEILVIGSTGKIGRRVAQRLNDSGHQVRAASRKGEVRFDWTDRDTWGSAIGGAETAFVMTPDETVAVGEFLAEAADRGVRRVVGLSGRRIQLLPPSPLGVLDAAVRASTLDWTLLQANNFNQNYDEGDGYPQVMDGEIVAPMGDVGEPFVDADDIAEVAATVLTDSGHAGKVYELSGPRAISFGEVASIIGRAIGRPVSYVDLPPAAFREILVEVQVPGELAEFLDHMYAAMREGLISDPAEGVQQVLGRAPIAFEDYASRTAAAGVWNK